MKLGIIGNGVIGRATALGLRSGAELVTIWDKHQDTGFSLHDVVSQDVVLVCVPTPFSPSQDVQDTTAVEESVAQAMEGSCKTVVVRSTTTVGTLEKLFHLYDPNGKVLLHWPEFLTARYALNDFLTAPFALLGAGIPGDLRTAPSDFVGFLLTRFPTVNVVTLTESQLVKIALNAYFATKVSYWNGVAKICKELAVPYDNIRRLVEADGRVAREHLRVPGPDGEWGFGGTCLPKDTRAMRELIGRFGGDVGLLTAVLEGNARMRSEV